MLFYLRWAVLIQVILVALLFIFVCVVKVIYIRKAKTKEIKIQKIQTLLQQWVSGHKHDIKRYQKFFKKNLALFLEIMPQFEAEPNLPLWGALKTILTETLFKPQARKLAKSRFWLKRFLAVKCFVYGSEKQDNVLLEKLVQDPISLVSIEATLVAVKRPTSALISAMIHHYSQGRRLQQSIFTDIITQGQPDINHLVLDFLSSQTNPYPRAFCYRLLTKLPIPEDVNPDLLKDTHSETIDLRISAINYLSLAKLLKEEDIKRLLSDKVWQVRVSAIKILKDSQGKFIILAIGQCLHDSNWWVRHNAAQALISMGPEGIAILESQDPKIDQYAYDAAKHVLEIKKNHKG